MSSVIGHSFAGIIAKQIVKTELPPRKEQWLLCLAIFLALLPDLDIVIYIIFKPSGVIPHRGLSHGLLFVLIASCTFTLLTVRYFGISKIKLFSICFLSLLSHISLDYLMGAGPPVPFFAPFFEKGFLSPIALVPCAFYSTSAKGFLQILFFPLAIIGFCLEILIFVPIVFFLRNPGVRGFNIILLLFFIFATVSTFVIYNLLS